MEVEILFALCKQRKISIHKVEKDLGYGNGYFRSLKKKEMPTQRAREVSNYFGVAVEYLMGATPESYLLWTEYKLAEAEKAYEAETDTDKRDEIGGEIDALRDSLEDQRLTIALTPNKPDGSGANGSELDELMEIRQALRERPEMRMLFDAGMKATPQTVRQTAQFLEGLANGESSD